MREYAIVLLLLCSVAVYAADKYVSTTGNDTTGDGSIGNPWRNIRKGVLTMSAGDTLNVRGGTYDSDGSLLQEFKTGISEAQPTVVQSYPGELATYKPTSDFLNMVRIAGKSNIVINGIEFNGDVQSSSAFKIDAGSQRITLTNCTIRACHDGHGLLISPVSTGAELGLHTVINCRFITNGWAALGGDSPLHQIYTQNSSNIIRGCYIEGVMNVLGGGLGIHDFASGGFGNVWAYNYLTNCNIGIGVVGAAEHDTQVYNNVIVGSLSWAISVDNASAISVLNNTCFTNLGGISIDSSSGVYCENNIVVGSSGANPGGVYVLDSDTIFVRNNLAYDSFVSGVRTWDYRVQNSTGVTSTGNKFTNISPGPIGTEYLAHFYNPSIGVLSIVSGSDAIDAGTPQTLFSDDYTGLARYRGSAWDIGAYEFDPAKPVKPRRNGGMRGVGL